MKTTHLFAFGLVSASAAADMTPSAACAAEPSKSAAWCDHTQPTKARVSALVAELTNAEKSVLFVNGAGAVPRLGIPKYGWWSEALHGVARDGLGTSFPQIIGVASSYNATLFKELGVLTGTEARGKNNGAASWPGDGGMYHGLTMWAPNVNIFRDPRWGRGQETPGEDPTLNGEYAENYIGGMQGDEGSAKYLRASACLKHYAAYSEEQGRNSFPAVVTSQDMLDTYLPAFEQGVKGGKASGLMCSYNAETYGSGIFGPGNDQQHGAIPSCANKGLLNDLIRDQWGFQGYVTSDCGAVSNVQNNHHYTNNTADTVKAVLSAGMDTDCGGFMGAKAMQPLMDKKQIDMAIVDTALARLFTVQMRLGFFDPKELNPYGQLGAEVVDTAAHRQLALEAAHQSIVLLKNEGNTLPLSSSVKSVAVSGRNAKATNNMQGNYYGTAPFLVSPVDGIGAYVANATTADCTDECDKCSAADIATAAANAAKADAAVVVVGLTSEAVHCADEAEGHDRSSLLLPDGQADVVSAVAAAAAKAGKPAILVVMSGGPVDVSRFKDDKNVGAIVWCGYPGQSGGAAIADVLFGKVNPSGKLTQTWYPESFTKAVSILDMGMRPNATTGNPGRSHRFYTGGDEVYKFGDGLSFSKFSSALALERGATTKATVTVTNSGEVNGDETVLLFAAPPAGVAGVDGAPLQQLIAFKKVHVEAGETVSVVLDVPAAKLAFAGRKGEMLAPKGEWELWVGARRAETKTTMLAL